MNRELSPYGSTQYKWNVLIWLLKEITCICYVENILIPVTWCIHINFIYIYEIEIYIFSISKDDVKITIMSVANMERVHITCSHFCMKICLSFSSEFPLLSKFLRCCFTYKSVFILYMLSATSYEGRERWSDFQILPGSVKAKITFKIQTQSLFLTRISILQQS